MKGVVPSDPLVEMGPNIFGAVEVCRLESSPLKGPSAEEEFAPPNMVLARCKSGRRIAGVDGFDGTNPWSPSIKIPGWWSVPRV
jgi:hypothetical protein